MLPAVKQCTTLIVDDEPANLKLLERMLSMNGYSNSICTSDKISALLGKGHGLEPEQCELLLNASPVHDIGKIGIPDQTLFNPASCHQGNGG